MTMQTVLRPVNSHEISASTTTARNSTAFKNNSITLRSASDFYIKLGGSTVTATTTAGSGYDKLCKGGVDYDINTGGATHVAVILGSGTDTIYINEWSKSAL